jgi:hypothetical protein
MLSKGLRVEEFFIKHQDGRIDGPFTASQLRAGVRVGKVTPSTLVRQDGRSSWHAAGSIPGLSTLFAEVVASQSAAGSAGSAPRGGAAQEGPTSTTVARGPAGNKGASEVPDRTVGLGDRVLRGAFQFARSISVLVIIASVLVALGGAALAVYALMPAPRLVGGAVDRPTLGEFVEHCARSEPAQQQSPGQQRRRGTGLEVVDACATYRQRSEAIVARLNVAPNAVEVLCSRVTAVPLPYREEFIDGLEHLSQQFAASPPKGESCSGADAANWYMREFDRRMELEDGKEALAVAQAVERRGLLMPALSAIGSAVAALLMFLILPLLIQIERNTRLA